MNNDWPVTIAIVGFLLLISYVAAGLIIYSRKWYMHLIAALLVVGSVIIGIGIETQNTNVIIGYFNHERMG